MPSMVVLRVLLKNAVYHNAHLEPCRRCIGRREGS
jgi:hypothetical protein